MTEDHVLLVHISDLHLAHPYNRNELGIGPSGLHAHDFALCEGLRRFFKDLALLPNFQPRSTAVIMSGDGSSTGSSAEFNIMATFLNEWRASCGDPPHVLIPGNHDH